MTTMPIDPITLHSTGYREVSARMQLQPPRPDPPALPVLSCFTCEGTIGAPVERLSGLGWVRATVAGRPVLFCGNDCVDKYQRRAPALAQRPAVVVDTPPPASKTWLDTPLTPNVQRPFRFVRAADSRHAMTVHRELQADGSWSNDATRLLQVAGWLERDGRLFCGPGCAGLVRPALPPIEAVERVNDASYQRTRLAAQGSPTERERSMAREVPVPDRPTRKLPR